MRDIYLKFARSRDRANQPRSDHAKCPHSNASETAIFQTLATRLFSVISGSDHAKQPCSKGFSLRDRLIMQIVKCFPLKFESRYGDQAIAQPPNAYGAGILCVITQLITQLIAQNPSGDRASDSQPPNAYGAGILCVITQSTATFNNVLKKSKGLRHEKNSFLRL